MIPEANLDEITRPEDCYLAVAIPLTREDVVAHWDRGDSDFINLIKVRGRHFTAESLWNSYEKLSKRIQVMISEVQRLGVTVKIKFSLDDLKAIRDKKVFTLLAHFSAEQEIIELANDSVTPQGFADRFPADFIGGVDMTLCKSTLITPPLKRKMSARILTISNRNSATLHFRVILYEFLIKYLSKQDAHYLVAHNKVRNMLR